MLLRVDLLNYLCHRVDQADAALVDGNEQLFGEIRLRCLFDLEESRAERGPAVNYLQEIDFGVFSVHS